MATDTSQTKMLYDLQTLTSTYSERLKQAAISRHHALEQAFKSPLFSLTSLMGPINDGPEWPSDAAWLALGDHESVTIISDGLSDPWVEKNRPPTGLGLEVYIKSRDPELTNTSDLMSLTDTWLFPMTAEISHTLASYPRLCDKLLANEPLSMQLNIEHIKDGRGLVTVLLHAPEHTLAAIENNFGKVQLVGTTLLTQNESRWLAGKGAQGRLQLKSALIAAGIDCLATTNRQSVV
ncbi:MAG: hypothetical protein MI976_29320 [Pseudomonadales bacterium]|nr:hypothetical protein [Pseudomonadales bacterium]